MNEFDTKQFMEWVYQYANGVTGISDVVLSNPTVESIFPCFVLGTALKRVIRTDNGIPVEIALSVPIEVWAETKYGCMELLDDLDVELRENLNLTRTITTIDLYDEITRKYRYGGNYETIYNALTGAFENRR